MQTINKVELTDSELEALYAERQNAKRKQAEEKRDSYESLRHQVVTDSVKYAVDMYETMKTAHGNIMSNMLGFRELMNEFGDLPKNSQGGFSILNKEGNLKTILKIRKIGEFDERADLAEQHIRIS
ncbi:DUF3164 family protein [Pseudarcicella hirudinis]|uniref:DUF3164 family protein n=1 Tax=Pseudarcicella hirudinis TaxID=1079859 RepID=UPI0035EC2496